MWCFGWDWRVPVGWMTQSGPILLRSLPLQQEIVIRGQKLMAHILSELQISLRSKYEETGFEEHLDQVHVAGVFLGRRRR